MGGYIGATAVGLTTTAADVQGDITSTDTTPELILKNTSEEDTEGGREGKITFKGEQSGGEESTLAQIESAHDGTADDQKGDLIFKTNDGSDGASPTEAMRIDSAQNVRIGDGTVSAQADADNLVVGSSTGNNGITIASATNGNGSVRFADTGGTGRGLVFYDHDADNMRLFTAGSERMRIDSSGEIGIGTSSPSKELHVVGASTPEIRLQNSDNNYALDLKVNATVAEVKASADLAFLPAGSEAARFDSSGLLRIGNTSGTVYNSSSATGIIAGTSLQVSNSAGTVGFFNRLSSDGQILGFYKNGTTVGSIGNRTATEGYISLGSSGLTGSSTGGGALLPTTGGNNYVDNVVDLGFSSGRFDDIYATNGTIQTSDANEKQQIASLTDAEMTAAKAISKLFKTFKWNDKVEAKGDAARTHTGVIAQQVEQAMTDAGLTASNYAFWCSDTWWETQTEVAAVEAVEAQDAVYDDDGNLVSEAVEAVEAKEAYTRTDQYYTQEEAPEGATERNRKGIRYPELLSFIGAATEQRLTSIEARLDALEG